MSRSMPPVSSTRSTIFSPQTVGSVAVRRSTVRSRISAVIRPFCGIRRSVMSTPDMIFDAGRQRRLTPRGTESSSCSTPSIRYRTRMSSSVGSRCRSEARFWIACSIRLFT